MKIYRNYVIDNRESDSIVYIGRYGEDICVSEIGNGLFNVESYLLEIYGIHLDEISRKRMLHAFYINGRDDFGKRSVTRERGVNLGQTLFDLYNIYQNNKDDKVLSLMKCILLDAEKLKLKRKEYIDEFLSFRSEKNKEYIKYMYKLRKITLKEVIYKWVILYSEQTKEGKHLESNGFRCLAHSKKDALKQFKLERHGKFKNIHVVRREDNLHEETGPLKIDI